MENIVYTGTITYRKDGKINVTPLYNRLSSYYKMFLNGEIYRENCYNCKYANKNRIGDITIGDYWGIKEEHPEYLIENNGKLDLTKGISCIIVNNKQGNKMLNIFGKNLILKKTEFSKVAKHNGQLNKPTDKPKTWKQILDIYKEQGYEGIDKYYNKRLGIKKYLYKIYYKITK